MVNTSAQVQLLVSVEEAHLIINNLAELPYKQVMGLIPKLQMQAQQSLAQQQAFGSGQQTSDAVKDSPASRGTPDPATPAENVPAADDKAVA